MQKLAILILAIGFFSCESNDESIADANDYNAYLAKSEESTSGSAQEAIDFWDQKLNSDSSGVGAVGPLASAYGKKFKETGDVKKLHDAEKLLRVGVEKSAHNKDAYMISLAANYISQHRFQDAKSILEQASMIPSNKRNLELAFFDVEMELGNYIEAYRLLKKNESSGDFSYLIRRSKWADHAGKLDEAIRYLEKANDLADAAGDNALKVWTTTNLADYYGHAGEIQKSYDFFLKALKLDPDNAYALKGIAWIAYAQDKNYDEADRILDRLLDRAPLPDYYLLKAEIAEARGLTDQSEAYEATFKKMAERPEFGRMYNTYLIELLSETNPEASLSRAKNELNERKTPETYALLAYSLVQNGKMAEAKTTIEDEVLDKTFEPVPHYLAAKVFSAIGEHERSSEIALELEDAQFELGPVIFSDIEKLMQQPKDA